MLAHALAELPDELMADFRQTYALSTWEMDLATDETTDEVLRAAALAYQLPADSRVMRALVPAAQHGADVLLLRRIEHNQRRQAWAMGGGKGEEPPEIELAGEQELAERAMERAEAMQPQVAAALGLRT